MKKGCRSQKYDVNVYFDKEICMLVLSREIGDTITVSDVDRLNPTEITFKIISLERNQVKVGITAPKAYKVLRPEAKDKTGSTIKTLG